MKDLNFEFLTSLVFLLAATGCSLSSFYVNEANIEHVPVLSDPADATLVVYLDERSIANDFVVQQAGLQPVKVFNMHAFAREDITRVFEDYFDEVRFVESESEANAAADSYRAQVLIADFNVPFETRTAVGSTVASSATMTMIYGQMEWAIAVTAPGESGPGFRLAERVTSQTGTSNQGLVNSVLAGTLSDAIASLRAQLGQSQFIHSVPNSSAPSTPAARTVEPETIPQPEGSGIAE